MNRYKILGFVRKISLADGGGGVGCEQVVDDGTDDRIAGLYADAVCFRVELSDGTAVMGAWSNVAWGRRWDEPEEAVSETDGEPWQGKPRKKKGRKR